MLYIKSIIEAFIAITHLLRPSIKPLFIKDNNSTYSYESTYNYYTR
jgi:hypothetical protein